jgi:hypothetical protein
MLSAMGGVYRLSMVGIKGATGGANVNRLHELSLLEDDDLSEEIGRRFSNVQDKQQQRQ